MSKQFDEDLAAYLETRDFLNNLQQGTSREDERRAEVDYNGARDRVTTSPALSPAELRAKAEIIWGDRESTPCEESRLSFLQDLQRLTDHAPSMVLDVPGWLSWFERSGGGWVQRDEEIVLLVPEDGRADGAMFELAAHGAREQVFEHIRKRNPAREAA